IASGTLVGRIYLIATMLTCVSAFGIFRHGGFNAGHGLGIIILVVLAVAWSAEHWRWYGSASPYVTTVGYSFTVFLHLVPGLTESLTRFPLGSPLVSGPQDPLLQGIIGTCFVLFLIGVTLQIVRLRARQRLVPQSA
ncbi:MAG TPA: hypothetical protein VHX44_19310, partial [Planctomycetota bacterium]|nr:hypothetical protein [Planctomycetota bacterium]